MNHPCLWALMVCLVPCFISRNRVFYRPLLHLRTKALISLSDGGSGTKQPHRVTCEGIGFACRMSATLTKDEDPRLAGTRLWHQHLIAVNSRLLMSPPAF